MTKIRFQADADLRQAIGAGVIRNLPIGEAIDAIILVWEASTAEEWIDRIVTFPF